MRILAISPNKCDGTSFYRAAGPLNALARQHPDIQIIWDEGVNWFNISQADCVFLQRPANSGGVAILEYCKLTGTPSWIDADDNLLKIPTYNPAYETYNGEKKEAFKKCLELADVVSVSTDNLKREFSNFVSKPEKIVVIPNALNDYMLKLPWKVSTKKVFMWRGTSSHQYDLTFYKDGFIELSKLLPDWEFWFFGYDPVFLTHTLPPKSCSVVSHAEVIYYMRNMWKDGGRVCLTPLVKDDLNLGKSNIAWIEGLYAGAVCVAPDTEEWRRPGCMNYKINDVQSFVETAFAATKASKDVVKNAQDYVEENLLLSNVNEQRVALLKNLLKGKLSIEQ